MWHFILTSIVEQMQGIHKSSETKSDITQPSFIFKFLEISEKLIGDTFLFVSSKSVANQVLTAAYIFLLTVHLWSSENFTHDL